MDELPNGCAFGGSGHLDKLAAGGVYFGLWLRDDLETGRSDAPCATFASPQLSGAPSFRVQDIEVWAVADDVPKPAPPPAQPEWAGGPEGGGVLAPKHAEARHFMEVASTRTKLANPDL